MTSQVYHENANNSNCNNCKGESKALPICKAATRATNANDHFQDAIMYDSTNLLSSKKKKKKKKKSMAYTQ